MIQDRFHLRVCFLTRSAGWMWSQWPLFKAMVHHLLVLTPLDNLQMCWWQRNLIFLRCRDNFKQFLATKTRILRQNSKFNSNQAFFCFCFCKEQWRGFAEKIRKNRQIRLWKLSSWQVSGPNAATLSEVTLTTHYIWRPNPIDMFYMQTLLICKVIREERSKKCNFPLVHTEKSCTLQMQNLFTCIFLIQLITVQTSIIISGEPALH